MARRKRRKTSRNISLGDTMEQMIVSVSRDVADELNKVLPQMAEQSRLAYERELRATGLRPSAETGSRERNSNKLADRASSSQSMFDIVHGVEKLPNRRSGQAKVKVFAGSRDSWNAKFFNDNVNHKEWGNETGLRKDDLGLDAKNFMKNAVATAEAIITNIFHKACNRGLKKADNKQKDIRN